MGARGEQDGMAQCAFAIIRRNSPLICAEYVSLICADQRTEGGVHQR